VPTPPPLSKEQRRAAYEKALELRRQRAEVKYNLAGYFWTLESAWTAPATQGMKVFDLLTALPGIGKARAAAMMAEAKIPLKNTVRACGPKQTERLFSQLR
jgi:hypothetical protein